MARFLLFFPGNIFNSPWQNNRLIFPSKALIFPSKALIFPSNIPALIFSLIFPSNIPYATPYFMKSCQPRHVKNK